MVATAAPGPDGADQGRQVAGDDHGDEAGCRDDPPAPAGVDADEHPDDADVERDQSGQRDRGGKRRLLQQRAGEVRGPGDDRVRRRPEQQEVNQ